MSVLPFVAWLCICTGAVSVETFDVTSKLPSIPGKYSHYYQSI